MKLSLHDITAKVKDVKYSKLGEKTSVCQMTLINGFEIFTASSCVDPADFDAETGNKFAYEKAIDKVWELEGYLLQENNYLQIDANEHLCNSIEQSTNINEGDSLGKQAYKAYSRTTDNKNFQGNPMPDWNDLPETIRKAWENASQEIEKVAKEKLLAL